MSGRVATQSSRAVNLLDLPERLQSKILPEPMSGCWLWLGALNGSGYGAHAAVYRAMGRAVPAGHELDHRCRLRCCVNPDHLEPVTHAVNMRRAPMGAWNAAKTHCPAGHEYTPANTRIEKRATTNVRRCRACLSAADRARKPRRS